MGFKGGHIHLDKIYIFNIFFRKNNHCFNSVNFSFPDRDCVHIYKINQTKLTKQQGEGPMAPRGVLQLKTLGLLRVVVDFSNITIIEFNLLNKQQ